VIRAIAITLILAIGGFIAAAILLPLPRVSSFEGFEAFQLLGWLDPISRLGALTAIVVTAVRWLARRKSMDWLAVFLPLLVLLLTAIHYLPFLALPDPEAGPRWFFRMVRSMRTMAWNIVVTFVLSAVFVAVKRGGHAPRIARWSALAVAAILCSILLCIYVLFILIPV